MGAASYLGSGATGRMPTEDIVVFFHRGGSNGKSTILSAPQRALGEYAQGLLPTMLGGRRAEHPTEFMDLLGARLAFVEETNEGHRLDMAKLKKYVGTEQITARRMRKDSVSFNPTHTLVVTTNYRPVVTDTDHGTWRRLKMVPFPQDLRHPGLPADPALRTRLLTGTRQREAVLAWVIDGAMAWAADGYRLPPEPESVRQATQGWREEQRT